MVGGMGFRGGFSQQTCLFLFCLEEMSPTFTQLQMQEDQDLFKICRTVFMGRWMVLRASLMVKNHGNGSDGKESACNVGDPGSIPGSGRSSGGGQGNPLQCSRLENSMDRGAWRATVHGVSKSRARLSDYH